MVYLLALVPPVLLAASAQASTLLARNYDGLHVILARQSSPPLDPSQFPPACQPMCTPIVNELNTCTSASCLCTNTNGQNLQSCMDCVIGIAPSEQALAQTVIDDFNTECAVAGISITPLSLSGSATSGGASASATTTATAPPYSFTPTTTSTPPVATTSSPSTGAATTTGSGGSGGSSNPLVKGAALGGKRLGTWGVVGVFGTGLASAVVLLM